MPALLSNRGKHQIYAEQIPATETLPSGVWRSSAKDQRVRARGTNKLCYEDLEFLWTAATATVRILDPVIGHIEDLPVCVMECPHPTEFELSNDEYVTCAFNFAEPQPEENEDVVEFRCLPPRVESIALLRNKLKLTEAAMDFVKRFRGQAFRIEEEPEEQSE